MTGGPNLIEEAKVIIISGSKKHKGNGCTMLAMHLGVAMKRGEKAFQNLEFSQPYNVIYIEGGMPWDEMEKRFDLLGAGDVREKIHTFWTDKIQAEGDVMPTLRDPAFFDMIEDALAEDQPNVIFYDSTATLFNESEEPEGAEANPLKRILTLRHRGVKQIFIDKGGFDLPNAYSDLNIKISPLSRRSKQLEFRLDFEKARFHEDAVESLPMMVLTMRKDKNGVLGFKNSVAKEIIKTMALQMTLKGIGQEEIADEIGRHQSTISRWIKDFEMMGICDRKGRQVVLTKKGKAWLQEYEGFWD
jgi:predicted transcriptional regulator